MSFSWWHFVAWQLEDKHCHGQGELSLCQGGGGGGGRGTTPEDTWHLVVLCMVVLELPRGSVCVCHPQWIHLNILLLWQRQSWIFIWSCVLIFISSEEAHVESQGLGKTTLSSMGEHCKAPSWKAWNRERWRTGPNDGIHHLASWLLNPELILGVMSLPQSLQSHYLSLFGVSLSFSI